MAPPLGQCGVARTRGCTPLRTGRLAGLCLAFTLPRLRPFLSTHAAALQPASASGRRSAHGRTRVERAGKLDIGAGDRLLTVRGESDRDHFQPGIEAEIGMVVLRGDGADQVGEKRGNLLERVKDEVAR